MALLRPDVDVNSYYRDGESIGNINILSMGAINSERPPIATFRCSGGAQQIRYESSANLSGGVNGIYPSGLPGIGYRIYLRTQDGLPFTGHLVPRNDPNTLPNDVNYGIKSPNDPPINVYIDLIKTGPIIAIGPFNNAFAVEKMYGQTLFEYQFSGTIPIIYPHKLTCALQPIPAVSLGKHPISTFTGPNATTSPMDFEVSLDCGGRTPGASINATMTFTDNTQPGNMTDVLSLYTSNVTGVGVQILKGGSPVHFGPQNAGIGSPNVENVGPITQPGPAAGRFTYRIPLQARYKQTGATVGGAGPANAQAMVTVNYQ